MLDRLLELKKRLLEEQRNIENRIQESNAFNLLKERYQSLNTFKQSLIKYSVLFCLIAFLAYFPLSYFVSSESSWGEFREKYKLSLELLKARKKISSSRLRLSKSRIQSQMEEAAEKYAVSGWTVKEKKTPQKERGPFRLVHFEISLEDLNVKQAVRLGAELSRLPQSRLSGLEMKESPDYVKRYHVFYKMAAFIPKESLKKREKKNRPSKRKIRRLKKELEKK